MEIMRLILIYTLVVVIVVVVLDISFPWQLWSAELGCWRKSRNFHVDIALRQAVDNFNETTQFRCQLTTTTLSTKIICRVLSS